MGETWARLQLHNAKLISRVGESGNYAHSAGVILMDAPGLREKAALCLRLASGLSWNNPGRLQLADLAERCEHQAKELELPNLPAEEDGTATAGARG
jgi:hypothetical protein